MREKSSEVFDVFESPAESAFGWLGVEGCDLIYIDDFRFSAKLWPWGKFLAFPNAKTVRAERGGGNTSQKRTTSTKRCINVALTMLLLYHLEAKDVFSTNKAEQWRRKSARPSNLRNHENSTYCPYMF